MREGVDLVCFDNGDVPSLIRGGMRGPASSRFGFGLAIVAASALVWWMSSPVRVTYTRSEAVVACSARVRELRPELDSLRALTDLVVAGALDAAHARGHGWTSLGGECAGMSEGDLVARGLTGLGFGGDDVAP